MEFYLQQIKYAITTIAMCIIIYLVCNGIEYIGGVGSTIIIFIVRVTICVSLPNLIYYFAYKNTQEYKSAYEWLRNKIRK